MGSPRKQRKKFSKPSHPWQKERILAEQELVKEYGLNRKYEIWKMNSMLKNFTRQAKNLIATKNSQADKESKQLLTKLRSLGLINKEAQIEDVLSLSLKNIMERRLQTLVHRRNLSGSARQARQFIVHGHIALGEKTVTAPSYLVPVEEEANIAFSQGSVLSNAAHPQRVPVKEEKGSEKTDEKRKKKESGPEKDKSLKGESKDKPHKPKKEAKTRKKEEPGKKEHKQKNEGNE